MPQFTLAEIEMLSYATRTPTETSMVEVEVEEERDMREGDKTEIFLKKLKFLMIN